MLIARNTNKCTSRFLYLQPFLGDDNQMASTFSKSAAYGFLKLFMGGILFGLSVPEVITTQNPLYIAGLLAGLLCILKGGVPISRNASTV